MYNPMEEIQTIALEIGRYFPMKAARLLTATHELSRRDELERAALRAHWAPCE